MSHYIEFNGKRLSITGWSKETGIPRKAICERIRALGWSIEKALSTPCISKTHAPKGSGYLYNGYRRRGSKAMVHEHREVVERVTGIKLKRGNVIHHVNHIRDDNRPENLVICPDNAYHALLHARERAYDACGNANWWRCEFCKGYDDPKMMKTTGAGKFHPACQTEHNKNRRRK